MVEVVGPLQQRHHREQVAGAGSGEGGDETGAVHGHHQLREHHVLAPLEQLARHGPDPVG